MSWQDYVDNQLLASQCVSKAAIAGHDGGVWAKSEGFEVSKEEVAKIVQGFDKTELLTSGGVTLAGQRYIYLSGTDRVIRAKLGKTGVHCMKTQQAVIVSIYEEPVQPQQAGIHSRKAGRLSNYLWLLERQTTFIGEEMGGGPEVCESIRREEARIRGSDERT